MIDKTFGFLVLFFGALIWIADMFYAYKRGEGTLKSALICSGVIGLTALCVSLIIRVI